MSKTPQDCPLCRHDLFEGRCTNPGCPYDQVQVTPKPEPSPVEGSNLLTGDVDPVYFTVIERLRGELSAKDERIETLSRRVAGYKTMNDEQSERLKTKSEEVGKLREALRIVMLYQPEKWLTITTREMITAILKGDKPKEV